MQLVCLILVLQLCYQLAYALNDEVDVKSGQLNVTLATIYELLDNNTNSVFQSDQEKESFINHFQYVLNSLLDDSSIIQKVEEGTSVDDSIEAQREEREEIDSSLIEEYSPTDNSESAQAILGREKLQSDEDKHGEITENDEERVKEKNVTRKTDEVPSSSSSSKTTAVAVDDNASVWELFKQQVQNDFRPLLMLIPKPVKAKIAEHVSEASRRIALVLSGALSPMLFTLSKLLSRLEQSVQQIARQTELYYATNTNPNQEIKHERRGKASRESHRLDVGKQNRHSNANSESSSLLYENSNQSSVDRVFPEEEDEVIIEL